MNLETLITPELWNAIQNSYEAENYTHAIKDAMSFVTDVLRDKSGLDGDGVKLVGAALGAGTGQTPKVTINRYQTETERDEQIGLREVLSGMYRLVRNTRAHERTDDTRETADTIVLFVDYLLGYLGKSQQSFIVQDFIESVTEPYFVEDQEYVDGLLQQIPVRKRFDTLIELWRVKMWGDLGSFKLVIRALFDQLTEPEAEDFLEMVSRDLLSAARGADATIIRAMLPTDCWPRLDRIARLRAEHMLVSLMTDAWYDADRDQCNQVASTWLRGITKYVLRKPPLRSVLLDHLTSDDFAYNDYVARFYISVLPEIFDTERSRNSCIAALCACVRRGNEFVKDRLIGAARKYPAEWNERIASKLEDLTDSDNPEIYLPDGTPFLGKFEAAANPVERTIEEDDIPF
jgi:uncharacterized protein (TIGR02391 family)